MLRTLLCALAPLAPLQESDSGFFLPGYLDAGDGVELTSPWVEGQRFELEVERRSEVLVDGGWVTVGGARSGYTVAVAGQTELGQWLLDFTASGTRSLLEPEDRPGALAHRLAGLGDGVTVRVLCDDFGVPDTVVAPGAVTTAIQSARAELIGSLQGNAAALAAELAPHGSTHVARLLELCDAWCIPLGYYLSVSEPTEFEYYGDPNWTVDSELRAVTYRLEEFDEAAAVARVSCDDRPADLDPEFRGRLDAAGFAAGGTIGPVIRSDWSFDLDSGLPTQVRRVTLERLGATATRDSIGLRVVGR